MERHREHPERKRLGRHKQTEEREREVPVRAVSSPPPPWQPPPPSSSPRRPCGAPPPAASASPSAAVRMGPTCPREVQIRRKKNDSSMRRRGRITNHLQKSSKSTMPSYGTVRGISLSLCLSSLSLSLSLFASPSSTRHDLDPPDWRRGSSVRQRPAPGSLRARASSTAGIIQISAANSLAWEGIVVPPRTPRRRSYRRRRCRRHRIVREGELMKTR